MKQMSLIEMDGFLKGKCIPRDLKVNETNAEYLVRKFAEAQAKCAALAAENAGLKAVESNLVRNIINDLGDTEFQYEKVQTPAADAFLAEVRAQGVEMAMEHMQSSGSLTFGDCYISLSEFADKLRQEAAPMKALNKQALRYGDNVLWFLNELAAYDASDIDGGEFDVYGEDRNGLEGCATIDVTELAADAAKLIEAAEKRIAELESLMAPQLTQPAPVSVPDEIPKLKDGMGFKYVKDGVRYSLNYANGWNQCRAAMLQAEPVSNSDELPLDYLQGHKDGLEWAAQLAEANHPQTGDWLYDDPIDLAKAIRKGPDMPTVQGGNSPVTPDGWISCSERMPDDGQHVIILCDGAFVLYAQYRDGEFFDVVRNGEEFFETQSRNVTHWMPLPDPPQEVNRG